jgi:hypothetical protein
MSTIPEDLMVEDDTTKGADGADGSADKDSKGSGRDHVELTPEQQKRFNRMYGQVKAQDEKLLLQGKHLEKLTTELEKARTERDAEKSRDAMDKIRERIRDARDNGDEDKADRLREQLAELIAETKVAAAKPKEVPVVKAQAPEPVVMSRADTALVTKWANEADADGNFIRPWTQAGNAKVDAAAEYLNTLLIDPDHDDLTMAEKLEMVDVKFGTKRGADRKASGPQVSGTDLTGAPAAGKNGLKDEEKRVAEKLFPHLSKVEAHKAYASSK